MSAAHQPDRGAAGPLPSAASASPRRRHRRAIAASIALVLVLLSGLVYVAAGGYVYNQVMRVDAHCTGRFADHDPAHWDTEGISKEFTVNLDTTPYLMPTFSDVMFPSRDPRNYLLHAWWVPSTTPTARTVILVHGQGSCRRDPVILLPAGMLHNNGFSVLLVDLRDNGDSQVEDGYYANGTEEYLDVLGAWDWLVTDRGIPAGRIGLYGESLGATVAIIAAGEEPRVAALWEGSAYGSFRTIGTEEMNRLGLPLFLFDAALQVGHLMTGDDVTSKGPATEIARLAGRPLFIVHGASDIRVNIHHAYDLAAAARTGGSHVEPWIVPGAHHSEAAFIDPAAYEARLVGFFASALTATTSGPPPGVAQARD